MAEAVASHLDRAHFALVAREAKLKADHELLLAENIKLGGRGGLPDTIVPFRAVVAKAPNASPTSEHGLLARNAELEAINANLLATNAALTVENRMIKERTQQTTKHVENLREAPKMQSKRTSKSPSTRRKKKRNLKPCDGLYTLPHETKKRFVRIVGDEVMVRGGGGFYHLDTYIQGHVKLKGTTTKEKKEHLAQLVQLYMKSIIGDTESKTTALPFKYYKNFTDNTDEYSHERREEYRSMMSAPSASSLVSHVVDLPASCQTQIDQRRKPLDSSSSYHSLDLADGLPLDPSRRMPQSALKARRRSNRPMDSMLSQGWDHVRTNINGLQKTLAQSDAQIHRKSILVDIEEDEEEDSDVFN